MKITILAIGSLGDVQPLVALGKGLQAAGDEVTVATHETFETFIVSNGFNFSLIAGNPREALDSEAGQAALDTGTNPIRSWRNFARMMNPIMLQTGIDSWDACKSTSEVIIFSPLGGYFGPSIAEKLKIPAVGAYYQPLHPTKNYPSFVSPTQRNLGGMLNYLTHFLVYTIYWLPYRSVLNEWRQEHLKLPSLPSIRTLFEKWRDQNHLVIYGFSPNVVTRPSDWGQNVEITGYWFLDRSPDWKAPSDLVDFLEAGPPPVYVGFGSMGTRNPKETTELVLKALARTKQRGIISTGWGALGQADLPDSVFKVEFIPHEWLFPKMAAVIHHGGAGTTAAGLRAGVPSIIVPFFVDQPFWGKRVADLGVGPKPIARKKLTVDRLSAAIKEAVSNYEMKRQAAILGERIRAEDGVKNAVEIINRHLSRPM